MSAQAYPALPATVQFVGLWTDEDRAQVITTLTPLIPALTAPWTLTYEHDATATTRTLAVIPQAYSAAVERDGQVQPVLSRYWDLPMFCRQLAAHIRAQAEGKTAPAAGMFWIAWTMAGTRLRSRAEV